LRSKVTRAARLRRLISHVSLAMLLCLAASGPMAQAQTESPPSVETPAAPTGAPANPTEEPSAPEQPSAPAEAEEGSTPEQPEASPSPSIEDLYAPDLPKKDREKERQTDEQESRSKEPVLYISDSDNGRIVVMQGISGEGFTSIGLPGYGLGRFLRPAQLWLDYAGRLHVADSGNNRVIRIDQSGQTGWTEVGNLSEPRGVAVDGSAAYVSDTKANRVVVYDEIVNNAQPREVLTHPQLKRPGELWIDAQGALYICCGEDPPGGKLLKTWTEKGLAEKGVQKETRRWAVFEGEGLSGSRFLPSSVITQRGGLKLLDVSGQRLVSMQDMTGKRLKEEKFRVDPRWRLSRPTGMAVDAEGRIYIADSGNDRILELSPDGNVVGEYYILDDDPGTLLANPTSIFIYSPAPLPAPKDDEESGKNSKGRKKQPAKKPAEGDVEIDDEW
jgi:sugar lactone lactonase YvrE